MKLKGIILIIWCLVVSDSCFAQSHIALKDVLKILLLTRGPVASGGGTNMEVLCENNGWNCYRTIKWGEFGKDKDTNRVLLKTVNKADLIGLLKIVNKADTALRLKNFAIDKKLLIAYIDSISRNSRLPDSERPAFVKYLSSDDSLQKALYRCMKLMGHSDYSYKSILVITNANDTIKVRGDSSKPYYLPWHIKGRINYNPRINAFFNAIAYHNNSKLYVDKGFYADLCKSAYMECFHRSASARFFRYYSPEETGAVIRR